MKYELKNNGKCWWVKGMIVEGEINGRSEILEINSIDICRLNKDIMSKEQIIECMKYPRCGFGNMDIMSKMDIRQCMFKGNDFTWRYELDKLEPLETIKMTQLDYEMLKLVQKQGAKYICRDEGGVLNICDTEPYQSEYEEGIWWSTGETAYLNEFFSKLFQLVKWEDKKYYVIEDVLNNCEVVEDD